MSDFNDWLAIANVKAAYCRLLDTKDWQGWGQLFTEDVVVDVRGSGGTGRTKPLSTIQTVRWLASFSRSRAERRCFCCLAKSARSSGATESPISR